MTVAPESCETQGRRPPPAHSLSKPHEGTAKPHDKVAEVLLLINQS
jgi:hypothetical protein